MGRWLRWAIVVVVMVGVGGVALDANRRASTSLRTLLRGIGSPDNPTDAEVRTADWNGLYAIGLAVGFASGVGTAVAAGLAWHLLRTRRPQSHPARLVPPEHATVQGSPPPGPGPAPRLRTDPHQPGADPRPARPIQIVDLLLTVAAVAAAITLGRFWQAELNSDLPSFFRTAFPTAWRTRIAGHALAWLIPATALWLAVRLRQPRRPVRRLARQPGFVACLVAALALAGQSFSVPLDLITMGGFTSPLLVASWYWPSAVGSAVLAGWLVLALSRRWQSRGDGVERLGMLIGLAWIGLVPALCAIEFLF